MTAAVTTAFWSVTINNYDDRDLAIVRNGYPDYCREIIHTLEEGKEGTPHIQAWVKLQRQQRMSFLRKLFPGGHFKPLTSAEYVENTKQYAQKNDETTRSAHVHVFHDPTGTLESIMKQVILAMSKEMSYEIYDNSLLPVYRKLIEKRMVEKDYKLAKIFVSATYKAMWKDFGAAMYSCVVAQQNSGDTHTHTHTDEKFSQSVNIPVATPHANEDTSDEEGSDADEDWESQGEDHSDGERTEDEADTEGGDLEPSEADDWSQSSE